MKKYLCLFAVLGLLMACTPEKKEVVATAIKLNKNELTIQKGANETLIVTFTPSDVTEKTLVWVSSDKNVAEVTDGVVVGVDAGSTEIIVKHGNLTDKCTVKVTVPFTLEAVDLGLSVKWANANLGANAPEDYGDYYAWGDVEPYYSSQNPLIWKEGKTGYNWASYKWCNGSNYDNLTLAKYNTSALYGTIDNKTDLDAEDDAAHVKLGGKWRMPTSGEVDELVTTRLHSKKHKWEWKSINGHNGWLVTYLENNNSIFLPATGARNRDNLSGDGGNGLYWNSSLFSENPRQAWGIYFTSSSVSRGSQSRCAGQAVRPVSD